MDKTKQFLLSILFTGFFATVCFCDFAFAKDPVEPFYPNKEVKETKEECMANFDIEKVDFQSPKAINNSWLLVEYAACKAVITNNVNECDKLSPNSGLIKNCRVEFNQYHAFLGGLQGREYPSPKALMACMNAKGWTKQKCEEIMLAMKDSDVTYCQNIKEPKDRNECLSIIGGDKKTCSDSFCKMKASYIKAMKTGDIKECDNITGDSFRGVKIMCQAEILGDESMCEKNKGFQEFKEKYCK